MKFNISDANLKTVNFKEPHNLIEKYVNLPFVPQKNEDKDRQGILMHSKEFNPVICLPASKDTHA